MSGPTKRSEKNGSLSNGTPWVAKGVSFAEGTDFRARYKGREFMARVLGGAMVFDGQAFKSPSAAAFAITGNSVNGWKFWETRRAGEKQWQPMSAVWKDQHKR